MKFETWCIVLMGVIVVAFLCLRLGGCETKPVEGTVTGKQWIPAHDDMYFIPVGDTQVPQWTHYDDEWRIYVGSRYVRVTKERFKQVEVEQFFKENTN